MAAGDHNQADRDVWIEKQLKALNDGVRILDAGAGEQKYKKYCSHLDYVSQDFGQYDGVGDSKGLQTEKWDQRSLDIICDITKIPQPDRSFDAILCLEVLEHLPEPILAIKEFSRILKSGGKLILTAPFCSLTHYSPYHFYSGFNSYFYKKHLPEFGFEILEIIENGNFYEFLAQEIRRLNFVTKKYTENKIYIIEKLARTILLRMLSRLSAADRGSSELSCFGYHVLGQKR